MVKNLMIFVLLLLLAGAIYVIIVLGQGFGIGSS
jgi:hypothetical protein